MTTQEENVTFIFISKCDINLANITPNYFSVILIILLASI